MWLVLRCERDVQPAALRTGTLRFSPDRFPIVATGNGWLRLTEVQWEGKPRLSGPDFMNGLQPGERDSLRFA